MMEDEHFLRRYAETGSETAFSELVTRHIDLVYSVALRLVGGDAHLAQDVVQTVFTDLSLKAGSLPRTVVLPGWLHRHTFFVASTAVRTEQRRRLRERQAAQMNALPDSTEPDWDQLRPFLDQALQELATADRDLIVLRYFQGRDLKSVGAALAINEDAAQKRVARAVGRLRDRLARHGVTLAAGALVAAIPGHAAVAAPAGLAAAVTASVFAGTGTASGTALAWLKFLAWLKTNPATVASSALVFAGVIIACLVQPGTGPATPTQPEAGVTASAATEDLVAAGMVPNGIPSFHWSQVESTDYRQYIANLRAIGCPEQTVRDIIVADLNQLYASRMLAKWPLSPKEFWRKTRGIKPDPDSIKASRAMEEERAAILKELLGVSISFRELSDLMDLRLQESDSQLFFLPAHLRDAASQVLRESGYEEIVAKLAQENRVRVGATDIHLSNSDQRELFDDKLKLLARVLPPAELEEFRSRSSPRAKWLRDDVDYFNCTPEEFKALLDLREQHLQGVGKDHLSVDRATAIEQVRTLLGEARAREYERVSDYGYLNGRRAAERAGLSAQLADQAAQIVFETRVAAEQTARDDAAPAEERQRQIDVLQAQAESRLNSEFSGPALFGIRAAMQRTIANTAQLIWR